jgi:exoribonuclease R
VHEASAGIRRQPLELDLPERKILLKPDGTVDRSHRAAERLDAHKLIEEMMIQANVAAAETLEKKKQVLIYRVHDAPSLAKQESLREFLADARHRAGARAAACAPTISTACSPRRVTSRSSRWSTRSCCARRARRSTARRISAISA